MDDKHEYILKMMFDNYYEEERRFGLISSKTASMIAITGVMFSIQSTMFINNNNGLVNSYILFGAIFCCLISLACFIYSYVFSNFKSATKPYWLFDKSRHKKSKKEDIIKALIINLPKTMEHNYNVMEEKIKISKYGFCFLILNCIFMLIYFLISIIPPLILFLT